MQRLPFPGVPAQEQHGRGSGLGCCNCSKWKVQQECPGAVSPNEIHEQKRVISLSLWLLSSIPARAAARPSGGGCSTLTRGRFFSETSPSVCPCSSFAVKSPAVPNYSVASQMESEEWMSLLAWMLSLGSPPWWRKGVDASN